MTETPKSRAEPTTVTGAPEAVEPPPRDDDRYQRPNRLSQVLAWVGIVAGVVFVVAVVFFAGMFIGWSSGGHYGWHRGFGQSNGAGWNHEHLPNDGARRHDGTRPDGPR